MQGLDSHSRTSTASAIAFVALQSLFRSCSIDVLHTSDFPPIGTVSMLSVEMKPSNRPPGYATALPFLGSGVLFSLFRSCITQRIVLVAKSPEPDFSYCPPSLP